MPESANPDSSENLELQTECDTASQFVNKKGEIETTQFHPTQEDRATTVLENLFSGI